MTMSSLASADAVTTPLLFKTPSISSSHSVSDLPGTPSSVSSTSSANSSIHFDIEDGEVVRVDGLRHAPFKLEAKKYKSSFAFKETLLATINHIGVPSWQSLSVAPSALSVYKVSGSLTNAVFFVSCPSMPSARTLLLRVYGPSSGALISRPRELHTLHVLSSQYRIGPKVFGTFENGRLEEYFESLALTATDLRDPMLSKWIGARMAELHSVDIEAIEEGKGCQITVKANVHSWIGPARGVVALPNVSDEVRAELDLHRFESEWTDYMHSLDRYEAAHDASKRVFAHNDTQYGNLLRLTKRKEGTPAHRQIIVVDFEYSGPNPAAFDIANHFHEWTADYHSETPHILDLTRYPTREERRNFYLAYLTHTQEPLTTTPFTEGEDPTSSPPTSSDIAFEMNRLEDMVRLWSPSSHGMWAVWGVVQARDDLESGSETPDFDYIGYARCRMAAFRRELQSLSLDLA